MAGPRNRTQPESDRWFGVWGQPCTDIATPMTTIFEALRADHDLQRQLIDELVETTGASGARQRLFDRLRSELAAHADHEERQFYVPLMQADMTQEQARHSVAEHKELDDLVAQLEEYDLAASQWLPTAETLRERLLHHLAEEEREVFQLAGKVLTTAQKSALASDYLSSMSEARTHDPV